MACCTTLLGPPKDLAVSSLAAKSICAGTLNVCGQLTANVQLSGDAKLVIGPSGLSVTGPQGLTGSIGEQGIQGLIGPAGLTIIGPTGAVGSIGPNGIQGIPGPAGTVGFAEYIRQIQSPNDSVPPGTAFTIDTEVTNNIPSNIVMSAGAGGTVFTLTTGTYVLDYEMSLGSAGSVAIYTGPTAGSLAIDTNTIAGSTTATTWIHGRAGVVVPGSSLVVAISSVVGTAAVVTAGTAAGFFTIRLTILKVA
jgi:hypothetical protein